MNPNFDVVIVGAGVAGLSIAWRINAKNPELRICIVEADKGIGGKCRTLLSNRAAFDIGGHFLHSYDQFPKEMHYIFSDWPRFDKNGITLAADDKMFKGPIQSAFPIESRPTDYSSLGAFYRSKFGDFLFDYFFGPYNSKLLGVDLDTVKPPDKVDVRSPKPAEKSYNATFLYPAKKGIQQLTDGLFDAIREQIVVVYDEALSYGGGVLKTKLNVAINYKVLVMTSPVRDHVKLKGRAPTVYVVNGFGRPKFSPPDNWTWAYIASKDNPFFRIGNYAGCGSGTYEGRVPFYAETSVEFKRTLSSSLLSKMFDDLILVSDHTIPHAYPVYVEDDEKVKNEFILGERESNVWWAGRYGKDEWYSVAETLLDSLGVADELIAKNNI